MVFASLRPAPSLHLPPKNYSTIKQKTLIGVGDDDLQSRGKQQQASLTCKISRRDAMLCIPAALVAPFIPTGPAEALSRKAENKRKVREKLEKLREKAGVTKEKTESSPEKKEKLSPNSLTVLPLVEASL
ncbi:uncharacterized protein LOC109716979 [Ananas comosus]|uniref:Uncharacterized protein LOC109716979 n=1 Tax=Ananas comosus TaxID=4615 RepID=A0A6P5FR91_ANACO|nr:uncharacterized protein LOC109716979 [Ananas comosus]